MRRGKLATAATTVALASALAGCGGGDSKAGGGSAVNDALKAMPASATQVQIYDGAAWKKAHDMVKVTGTTSLDPYTAKLRNMPSAGDLFQGVYAMTGWGWNAMDVDWSATANVNGMTSYYRFRDGLDLKTVADSLTKHGYTKGGSADEPTFTTSLGNAAVGGLSTAIGTAVRLYPSKHLMVTRLVGEAPQIAGKTTLADSKTVRQLTAGMPSLTYLDVQLGSSACAGSGGLTSEQRQQAGLSGLGTVTGAATGLVDDGHGVVHTLYASKDAATSDLPRRQKLLQGNSIQSARPYSQIGTFTEKAKDDLLVYDAAVSPSLTLLRMTNNRDVPWAFCGS